MFDTLKVKTDIQDSISFFKTEGVKCRICKKEFYLEEMRIGGGRLDAGGLSLDLHREYLPTAHGEIFPLIYQIITCPGCYFSLFRFDFSAKLSNASLENVISDAAREERTKVLKILFNKLPDFTEKRNLITGFASYILAMETYNTFSKKECPTIRMAICSLRAAWLVREIQSRLIFEPGEEDKKSEIEEELEWYQKIFYRKTAFLYNKVLELNEKAEEDMLNIPQLGPDFDKDYSYDGFIYLHAWLNLHYGRFSDVYYKIEILNRLKINLSKVFGFGKSSKEKPSALLDIARDVYTEIENELTRIV